MSKQTKKPKQTEEKNGTLMKDITQDLYLQQQKQKVDAVLFFHSRDTSLFCTSAVVSISSE